jgi:histidinol-phosphate aminotransferase
VASLEDLPIRDDLRGRKPYGAPQLNVPVSLNVNENTHRIPEQVAIDVVAAIAASLIDINRYPDREFTELRSALAQYLGDGLTEKNLWAANGSNEVLLQIFQAFGGPNRKALGFGPTYSMYSLLALTSGTKYVDAERAEKYELTPELVVEAIEKEKPSIVLLCSPNNPTGTPLSLSVIEAAYDATDGVVVVDEAYAEFSAAESATSLLQGRPRLLVSRTMSKAFAFAGARVGYLAADPAAVDALRLVRLPYHLSAFSQAAATAALKHSKLMLKTVEDIRYQRDRISVELAAMGFEVFRSEANFVLFAGLRDSAQSFDQLLSKGILVRNVGIPNTLRVSAGTEEETTKFLEAAQDLVKL